MCTGFSFHFHLLAWCMTLSLTVFLVSPAAPRLLLLFCSPPSPTRHKYTEANGRPAETPDGFWDLSFADSVNSEREHERLQRAAPRGGGGGDGGGKGKTGDRNGRQHLAGGDHDSLGF